MDGVDKIIFERLFRANICLSLIYKNERSWYTGK